MKRHRNVRKYNSWISYLNWYNRQKTLAIPPSAVMVLTAKYMAKGEEEYERAKNSFHRYFQAYKRALKLKLHTFKGRY